MADKQNSHEVLDTYFELDGDEEIIQRSQKADGCVHKTDALTSQKEPSTSDFQPSKGMGCCVEQHKKVYHPPSFMVVVLIAVVAILFGYILGYISATMSIKQSSGIINAPASQQGTSKGLQQGDSQIDQMTRALPEGHPDVHESLETLSTDSK